MIKNNSITKNSINNPVNSNINNLNVKFDYNIAFDAYRAGKLSCLKDFKTPSNTKVMEEHLFDNFREKSYEKYLSEYKIPDEQIDKLTDLMHRDMYTSGGLFKFISPDNKMNAIAVNFNKLRLISENF
jgi:hypothetical protein